MNRQPIIILLVLLALAGAARAANGSKATLVEGTATVRKRL